MLQSSPCKINIGLHITQRRADGYHNLETVFYPVPLYDVLEAFPANATMVSSYGLPLPIPQEQNIVYKAWQLLKKDFPQVRPLHFYLLKNIPSGAGLGAGSANGALALQMIDKMNTLGLSHEQLGHYALQLGSDCPFFIQCQPAFAGGRGEELKPIALNLSGYYLAIINPGIHISTPWAFQQITPQKPEKSLIKTIAEPVESWRQNITNDFEKPVIAAHPEIGVIKNELYRMGAVYAAMSGSGSSVFGLFKNAIGLADFFSQKYFTRLVAL